jgi:tRNA(Arg) A34 adenosine deaminase TadA
VSTSRDIGFMRRALELAKRAALANEVPVGAVLVLDE